MAIQQALVEGVSARSPALLAAAPPAALVDALLLAARAGAAPEGGHYWAQLPARFLQPVLGVARLLPAHSTGAPAADPRVDPTSMALAASDGACLAAVQWSEGEVLPLGPAAGAGSSSSSSAGGSPAPAALWHLVAQVEGRMRAGVTAQLEAALAPGTSAQDKPGAGSGSGLAAQGRAAAGAACRSATAQALCLAEQVAWTRSAAAAVEGHAAGDARAMHDLHEQVGGLPAMSGWAQGSKTQAGAGGRGGQGPCRPCKGGWWPFTRPGLSRVFCCCRLACTWKG